MRASYRPDEEQKKWACNIATLAQYSVQVHLSWLSHSGTLILVFKDVKLNPACPSHLCLPFLVALQSFVMIGIGADPAGDPLVSGKYLSPEHVDKQRYRYCETPPKEATTLRLASTSPVSTSR